MINAQSNDEEGSKICVQKKKNMMEAAITGHKDISCGDDNTIDVSFAPFYNHSFSSFFINFGYKSSQEHMG